MGKARVLAGLAKDAKGKIAKGAKEVLPKVKNVRRIRNVDIPKRPAPPKPNATNPRLKNIIDNIWKHAGKSGTAGDGTTFDALRNEILTGRPSNGIFHMQKSIESMRGLQKIIDSPNTSAADRAIAEDLLRRFGDAFGRGWG
ncbi:hypothetical protein [Actinopolymorpha rutila]|uniref:Uncharacterized protein n=1 Tax=Actinopolymorpha rutila TaxID=446787 RepID=A0A852ZY32_9ACTN|nr:hypothetical protein [Actinopolymorpha rutila]NYH93646.1 hypothetical protein [Actinopolymorpha rutila]